MQNKANPPKADKFINFYLTMDYVRIMSLTKVKNKAKQTQILTAEYRIQETVFRRKNENQIRVFREIYAIDTCAMGIRNLLCAYVSLNLCSFKIERDFEFKLFENNINHLGFQDMRNCPFFGQG